MSDRFNRHMKGWKSPGYKPVVAQYAPDGSDALENKPKNAGSGKGKVPGAAKGPSQFSMGRSQAKSLLTQKASASVPLGGMNWGNILTRGGLKMLGVLGGIMSPSKTVSADQEKKHMKQGY